MEYRGVTFHFRRTLYTRNVRLAMTFPGYEDHDEIKKNFKTVEQAATEGKRIVDYTFLIAAQKELAAKEATDGI